MSNQLKITIEYNGHKSYFYYPDYSCKTKDGGMKMLLKELEENNEPYTTEIWVEDDLLEQTQSRSKASEVKNG